MTTVTMTVLDETMEVSAVVCHVPRLDAIIGTSTPNFQKILLKGLASGALGEPDSCKFISVVPTPIHSVNASTTGGGDRAMDPEPVTTTAQIPDLPPLHDDLFIPTPTSRAVEPTVVPLKRQAHIHAWGHPIPLDGGKEQLLRAQRDDPTLEGCR